MVATLADARRARTGFRLFVRLFSFSTLYSPLEQFTPFGEWQIKFFATKEALNFKWLEVKHRIAQPKIFTQFGHFDGFTVFADVWVTRCMSHTLGNSQCTFNRMLALFVTNSIERVANWHTFRHSRVGLAWLSMKGAFQKLSKAFKSFHIL